MNRAYKNKSGQKYSLLIRSFRSTIVVYMILENSVGSKGLGDGKTQLENVRLVSIFCSKIKNRFLL